MGDGGRKRTRTLADKLDHLFATVRPAEGEYTHEEVASAIRDSGGPTISATYVWQLRKGLRDNPTNHHMEALGEFFGVPAAYFFDDDPTGQFDAELAVLAALRDDDVRQLAQRADGLSPDSLRVVTGVAEQLRLLEGLPQQRERNRRRPR